PARGSRLAVGQDRQAPRAAACYPEREEPWRASVTPKLGRRCLLAKLGAYLIPVIGIFPRRFQYALVTSDAHGRTGGPLASTHNSSSRTHPGIPARQRGPWL